MIIHNDKCNFKQNILVIPIIPFPTHKKEGVNKRGEREERSERERGGGETEGDREKKGECEIQRQTDTVGQTHRK